MLALFLGVSRSPLVAVIALIFIALAISVRAGLCFNSWFFFTVVIIYVGGIMVIFVYLSSLISRFKINLISVISERGAALLGALRVFYLQSPRVRTRFFSWTGVGFYLISFGLIRFLIFYLLIGLISVFKICDKTEGPLINKIKY